MKLTGWITIFLLLASAGFASTNPQAAPSANQAPAATTAPTAKAPLSSASPSAADIAAAKASHKVWVNLDSGIYHKGGRWYGKTKNGKFMTADEATKAGYKAAKRD
jgi:hypothetical protein